MLGFIKFVLFIVGAIYLRWFVYPSIRYKSDKQKIVVFVGKVGSFKSTEMIRLAVEGIKRGRRQLSNTYIPVHGVEMFSMQDVLSGKWKFPKHCDIYWDEASDTFDNRKFKTFPQTFLDTLNDYRHDDQNFNFFCQNWDLDKKIRDRASYIIYMSKLSNTLGLQRMIIKRFGLKPAEYTQDSDSQMVDVLDYAPFFSGGFMLHDYEQYFYLTDTHKELHVKPDIPTMLIENKGMKKRHKPKIKKVSVSKRGERPEPSAAETEKATNLPEIVAEHN